MPGRKRWVVAWGELKHSRMLASKVSPLSFELYKKGTTKTERLSPEDGKHISGIWKDVPDFSMKILFSNEPGLNECAHEGRWSGVHGQLPVTGAFWLTEVGVCAGGRSFAAARSKTYLHQASLPPATLADNSRWPPCQTFSLTQPYILHHFATHNTWTNVDKKCLLFVISILKHKLLQ